jgi:inner membrane protein
MENNQQSLNIFERLNRWIQESITVKLFSIGFLVIILLIPSSWINDLIVEREMRAEGVMQEVYQKWSGNQTLSGPVLVIPYKRFEKIDRGKDGVEIIESIEKYFFLPEKLNVTGEVTPKVLHRGIFDAAVYNSTLTITSDFTKPNFPELGIREEHVLWKDAYMVFSVSDLRGISDNPVFKVGEQAKETEPASDLGFFIQENYAANTSGYYADAATTSRLPTSKGIIAKLNWAAGSDFAASTSVTLSLKGSKNLSFLPTGKTTEVKLTGAWANPSFDGDFLPEDRNISDTGFSAFWKILHYNRPFSQQWTGSNQINGSAFGVTLLVPVDQYQKSIRTSKYGQLVIILTFVALFLVEIIRKIRIHPFQYILIGVALIIYYTLLLSISEQVGYNLAYGIASLATVVLISLYASSFLHNKKLVALLSVLLCIFYGFIFVIILQQDFSLLLGSVGLFLIVAALMYFSRKVEWYKETVS